MSLFKAAAPVNCRPKHGIRAHILLVWKPGLSVDAITPAIRVLFMPDCIAGAWQRASPNCLSRLRCMVPRVIEQRAEAQPMRKRCREVLLR